MQVPPPHTPSERELEQLQKKVTEGLVARQRRDDLAYDMWQDGMTQGEIAARLNRADGRAGGVGVSGTTVQKFLSRLRKERES